MSNFYFVNGVLDYLRSFEERLGDFRFDFCLTKVFICDCESTWGQGDGSVLTFFPQQLAVFSYDVLIFKI